MDPQPYGPFPYRPITDHLGLSWPNGKRLAFIVMSAFEYFPLDMPVPGPRSNVPETSAWGRRDYGNRVGAFRIMDTLSQFGIRGAVALNSMICDYCPQLVEKCIELDWELIAHGETNAIKLTDYETEQEAADCIRRSIARIAEFSGKRPKGWVGASRQQTWSTLDVLVEEGCTYTFDWDNDDQPVAMQAKDGIVVSLPYGAGASDNQAFNTSKLSPVDFEQMLKDGFDVLYRESEISGRVYTISLHSYIVGVPHRIASLERALGYICGHDDVWLATGEEVTDSFLTQHAAIPE